MMWLANVRTSGWRIESNSSLAPPPLRTFALSRLLLSRVFVPSPVVCFCLGRGGEQLRRLAVEIEVKHGRLALGAVVCAMAQQGILTVAA